MDSVCRFLKSNQKEICLKHRMLQVNQRNSVAETRPSVDVNCMQCQTAQFSNDV